MVSRIGEKRKNIGKNIEVKQDGLGRNISEANEYWNLKKSVL